MPKKPSVWVFTVCYNEEALMPYFLRHYSAFAEKIILWDSGSTDQTRAIIRQCPIAELREFPQPEVFDDVYHARFANEHYQEARGQADWCIWVDADEFVYHPHLLEELAKHQRAGATILDFEGYQMFSDRLPTGPGQIYDELNRGVAGYRKPGCVFSPELRAMNWGVGKHTCRPVGDVRYAAGCRLNLFHYRFLGLDYLLARNAGNYGRLAERSKELKLGYHVYPAYWQTIVKEYEAGLQNARSVFQTQSARLIDKIHQGVNPYTDFPVDRWEPDDFGWDSQHHWFEEFIEALRPPVIVEVGSFLGRSARHMAACLQARQIDGAVVCVDTWLAEHILWTNVEHRPKLRIKNGRPEFYNVFMANTLAAGLSDYIVPLPMASPSAARLLKVLNITAPMIYIDGSHEAGDVYADLALYYDLVLEPGGVMIIDDYNFVDLDMMHGLLRDVHRFCADRGLQLNVSGWKALLYKPPAAPDAPMSGPWITPQEGELALAIVTGVNLVQSGRLAQLNPNVLYLLRQNAEQVRARGEVGEQWAQLAAEVEELWRLTQTPAPDEAAETLQLLLEAPEVLEAVQTYRAQLDARVLALVHTNAAAARAEGEDELAEGLENLAEHIARQLVPQTALAPVS